MDSQPLFPQLSMLYVHTCISRRWPYEDEQTLSTVKYTPTFDQQLIID